jgi:glutaredoxin-like protein NrdH
VQCTATTRALEARGLAFDLVDLTEDAAAMELVQGLGYRQAPVVIAGEEHWAGFRPDMISRLS